MKDQKQTVQDSPVNTLSNEAMSFNEDSLLNLIAQIVVDHSLKHLYEKGNSLPEIQQ